MITIVSTSTNGITRILFFGITQEYQQLYGPKHYDGITMDYI